MPARFRGRLGIAWKEKGKNVDDAVTPKISRMRASMLLSGAALAATRSPGRAQAPVTIRVVNPPIELAAQSLCAKDMGFFAKAGLDVEIQILPAGVPAAVASNSFEFGWVTIDALATAHVKGIPLVAIAPSSEYVFSTKERANTAILVTPNSPFHQAKDLDGKVLALPSRRGISESSTSAWIDQNGGDSTTVKFIEVPFAAMAAALDAGRIDAAYVIEPFLDAIGNRERSIGNPVFAIAKRYLNSAWVTTQPYAAGHPEVVSRFAAVMRETAKWINQNPQKSGEIVAKYTKIDPAVIASMVRSHFADQLAPSLLQPVIDVSAKYNKFTPFPATELIYSPAH